MYALTFTNGQFLINDQDQYEFYGNTKSELARRPAYSSSNLEHEKVTFAYKPPDPRAISQLETYFKQLFYPDLDKYAYFLDYCCSKIFNNNPEILYVSDFEGRADLLHALDIWTKNSFQLLAFKSINRVIEQIPTEYGYRCKVEFIKTNTYPYSRYIEIIDLLTIEAMFDYHAPKDDAEQYETRHYPDIWGRKFALEHRSAFFALLVRHQNNIFRFLHNYQCMTLESTYYLYYLPKDLKQYIRNFLIHGLIAI
jgi:hypothetical protein